MMKNSLIFYFLISLLFLPISTGHAAEKTDRIILGQHYDIFRDTANKATIEDLISGTYDKSFVASHQDYLFFWHTKDTIWLKLPTKELITNKQDYWIEITDKLDNIELYLVKEDGSYHVQKRGISNIDERNIQYRSTIFHINDPSVKEIYLKLDGIMPISVISYLYTTDSFINSVIGYKHLTGIFYGFLSALLIYNLFYTFL